MEIYDPLTEPDPDEWLSMDESERIDLVTEHHSQAGEKPPNEQLHAVIHVVVETQVAMGDETPTQATLARMMREGLDRHDAIHAVGTVVMLFLKDLIAAADEEEAERINEKYFEELGKLTAAGWLEEFS